MSRIHTPAVEQSVPAAQPLLAAVQKQLGMVPNLMKVTGNSPAALEGYLALSGALGKGSLAAPLRERIALAVAEFNQCGYCLAAHTYLGKNVARLSLDELEAARGGHSEDARVEAALTFALRVASARGKVSDADIAALRLAGYDDAAAIEIVAHVALNVLTNYINNVAQTDVDFPAVQERLAA